MRKRSLSRRNFLRTTVAVAAGAAAARVPLTVESRAATSQREVTLRYMGHITPDGTAGRDKALKLIYERFTAKHPNIKMQFERVPWYQINQKYMAAWEAGDAPDIVLVPMDNVLTVVRQGSVEDLTPYISRWPKEEVDDFYNKKVWQHGIFDGKKYHLQTFMFTYLIAYRKSIFEKDGFDVRKIRTWDDFIKATQAVTVDRKGKKTTDPGFDAKNVQTWGWGVEGGRTGNWPMLLGWLLTEMEQPIVSEKDWKADWTSEKVVTAFTMLTDFITKYKIQSPGDLSADLETAEANFASGVYASTLLYSNRLEDFLAKAQYDPKDVYVSRPPSFDRNRLGPLATRVWTMAMNSKSKNKEEAWLFMTEYFSKQGDMDMVIPGGQLPMRTTNLNRPELNTPQKAYVQIVKEGFADWSYMEPNPPTPFGPHWLLAYHEIITQGVPVKQALQKAQDAYHKLLAEVTGK